MPKISELNEATSLAVDDLAPVVQGGTTKKTRVQKLLGYLASVCDTVSGVRTSLSVPSVAEVAAGYQPLDTDLTAVAALTPANDDVIQRKAGAWVNRNIAQLTTDLGLAAALALKANLASPAFTAVPTAPTAAAGTDTTQIATTAFVQEAIEDLATTTPTVTYPDVPAERSGFTLVWRDNNLAAGSVPGEVTAAAPGSFWDVVLDGRAVAGVPDGPSWLTTAGDQSTKVRRCTAIPDTISLVAGHTSFVGRKNVSLPTSGCIPLWIRPTMKFGQGGATNQQLVLYFTNGSDGGITTIGPRPGGTRQIDVTGTAGGPALTQGEWALLYVAWDGDNIKVYVKTSPDSEPQLVRSTTWSRSAIARVYVYAGGGPAAPAFSGQIAGFAMFSTPNMATAELGPTGYVWPTAAGAVPAWSMDASAGSDANALGPWQTFGRLVQAVDDSVVMGSSNRIIEWNGSPIGRAGLVNADAAVSLGKQLSAGEIDQACPEVVFEPGVYLGHTARWKGPAYCKFRFKAGAYLDAATAMPSSWTSIGSNMYTYTGTASIGRHVWGANNQAFYPALVLNATTLADVNSIMSANPWYCWSSPSGVTTISLPAGVTPTSIGPMIGTIPSVTSPEWVGNWVKGCVARYWRAWIYNAADVNHLVQLNCYQSDVPTSVTIYEDCKSIRWGRKWGGFAYTGGNDAVVYVIRPGLTHGPTGANNGAFVGYTDQTGSIASEITHESYYDSPDPPGSSDFELLGSANGQPTIYGYTWNKKYLCHGQTSPVAQMRRVTFVGPPEAFLDPATSLVLTNVTATYIPGTGGLSARMDVLLGNESPRLPRLTLTADVTAANSTLVSLPGLSHLFAAGREVTGRYVFQAGDATAADGIKFDLDGGTATWTLFVALWRLTDGAGVVTISRTTAIATDATVATFTNPGLVEVEFYGAVNAAGTLVPRFAKNSGTTGNATVYAGSSVVVDQQ